MSTANVMTRSVTDRGNKDMKLMTVYLEPELLKKFKAICALEGESMTKVVHDYIKKFVKEKQR